MASCLSPVFLTGTKSLRGGAGSRLAKPSRRDAREGDLDAVPASRTMGAEEDWPRAALTLLRMNWIDLRKRVGAARPCRAGAPSAEPGGGRASGAAQRAALIGKYLRVIWQRLCYAAGHVR